MIPEWIVSTVIVVALVIAVLAGISLFILAILMIIDR